MTRGTTADATAVFSRYWHRLEGRRRRTRRGIRRKRADSRDSTSSTKVLLTPREASRRIVSSQRGASCH
jgi:hypothetical protein